MKKGIIGSLIVATFLMTGCASNKSCDIAYVEAHGYFVRNDVVGNVPNCFHSKADFDSIFGYAAVMGKDGMPTKIDFNKNNVIAVVGKETNCPTEYSPISLTSEKDTLYLKYSCKKDISTSYVMVPVMLLVIDKTKTSPIVKLEEVNCK